MRIVLVNKFLELTGGADRHCTSLAAALETRGHEVRFLAAATSERPDVQGEFVPASVTHANRDSLSLPRRVHVAASATWNPLAARAMTRMIDEFRPDVVHTHKLYPQLSASPAFIAARRGVPVVQTLHDFEFISASPIDARGGWWDADETRLSYKILNAGLLPLRRPLHMRHVTAYVSISRFLSRVYARHGVDSTVIPSFVDVPEHDGGPGFDDRHGVVFIGRLRPEKGVADVVELARLLPEVPVTVGGHGVLADFVDRASATMPNLTAAGFVSDEELTRLIEGARVVVVPSRCQEGGNLVALEAIARGTPVVAYANGGLAENIVDTGGGRLVPVDVTALVAATAEVHDDRAEWESLSRQGRAAAVRRYSADVYAADLERVYGSALSPQRGRQASGA